MNNHNVIAFREPLPLIGEIKKQARIFFDNGAFNEGREYDEARGIVNHLRHNCTNYEALRYAIRVDKQGENDNLDILALKKAVLSAIRDRFPEFRTECLRQEEWLKHRTEVLEASRVKYLSPGPGGTPLAPALDLIGAETETVLSLKARMGELERELAARGEEISDLQKQLISIRNTPIGVLYDEFLNLRNRAAESDRLRNETESYLRILRKMRTDLLALALDAEPGPRPDLTLLDLSGTAEPKAERKRYNISPETREVFRANMRRAHAVRKEKAAARRMAKEAAKAVALTSSRDDPEFQV